VKLLAAFCIVAILLVCFPHPLLAWTPGTHVVLGERILSSLELLPQAIGDLLRAFPYDFLYGSIAADTTMAKKFAPADRHCHAWHVGREVYQLAPTDALRAFGTGYLAHLAADTVAHNYFVPRQLVTTSSTRAMGHTWWEARVELLLGDAVPAGARDLIRLDHRPADAHLERILSPTIFSVRTNRRLFRGMVRLTDSRAWQIGLQMAQEQSRWEMASDLISSHLDRATHYIRSVITDEHSPVLGLDPNGERSIMRSKSVRRDAIRGHRNVEREWIASVADAHFGLPPVELDAATRPPVRSPAPDPVS
jgi:hypothetical protein